MPRLTRAAALLATATLILAACGPGAGGSTAPSTEPSAAPSTEPSTAPSTSAGSGEVHTVNAVQDTTLGAYLTGESGKTLYIFKNDSPDTSTCTGGCADNWPPFVIEADETVEGGAGITGTFGTITRSDGKIQVTYDHQPLHYFAGDSAAGDTNGQGIGGVWFVAPVSGGTASASPGRGDY